MSVSGCKHILLSGLDFLLFEFEQDFFFQLKTYYFTKLRRNCKEYPGVIIPSDPISFMCKLSPVGVEGRGNTSQTLCEASPHLESLTSTRHTRLIGSPISAR